MGGSNPSRVRPTSRDVAALAGVAQSTVSAAMSGNRTVAPETKQRIQQAMLELGYQPNAGARTLRTAKTNVIALVIEFGSAADAVETVPYVDTIIEGARQRDYDVVLSTRSEGPTGLRRLIGRSICDAVLVMDVTRQDERIPAAAELQEPVVLVGRPDDSLGIDVVDYDSRLAGEMLVEELAATGHDTVLAVGEAPTGAGPRRDFLDFYEGAEARAKQRGLAMRIITPASNRWKDVQLLGAELDRHRGERLGLVARTPHATEWLFRLLTQRGMHVGKDVSVVAMCTEDVASSFEVPLTHVSPLPREVSARAVEILFRRIDGDDSPPIMDLIRPTGLVRRASTTRFDVDGENENDQSLIDLTRPGNGLVPEGQH